jgi:hypothetical protein
MCSWLITAPAGIATDIVYVPGRKNPILVFEGEKAQAELKLFFEEAYNFVVKRYFEGKDENIICAPVHKDETTPHMHMAFVPVCRVRHKTEKGKEIDEVRVNAKDLITQKDLKTFHKDLENHMEKVFGRVIGILNDATRDGNKTIQQLKNETAIGVANAELEAALKPIEGKLAVANTINKIKDNVKDNIVGVGCHIKGVTAKKVIEMCNRASTAEKSANRAKNFKVVAEKAEKRVSEVENASRQTVELLKQLGKEIDAKDIKGEVKRLIDELKDEKKTVSVQKLNIEKLEKQVNEQQYEISRFRAPTPENPRITPEEKQRRIERDSRNKKMNEIFSPTELNNMIATKEAELAAAAKIKRERELAAEQERQKKKAVRDSGTR